MARRYMMAICVAMIIAVFMTGCAVEDAPQDTSPSAGQDAPQDTSPSAGQDAPQEGETMTELLSQREALEKLEQKYGKTFQVLDRVNLANARRKDDSTIFDTVSFSDAVVYLCAPSDEPEFQFCASNYSIHVGSPIPRSGGYNWYFEDDYGARLMNSKRFVPVAEQQGLPYTAGQVPVFFSGVYTDADVWSKAYEKGLVPFSLEPLSEILYSIDVSDQNKNEIAGQLLACIGQWNSPAYEYPAPYDSAVSMVLKGDDGSQTLWLSGELQNESASCRTKEDLLDLIGKLTVDHAERLERLRADGKQLSDLMEQPEKYESFFADRGIVFQPGAVSGNSFLVKFKDGVQINYDVDGFSICIKKPYKMQNETNVTINIRISKGQEAEGEKTAPVSVQVCGAKGDYFKGFSTQFSYVLPGFQAVRRQSADYDKEAAQILDQCLPVEERKELYQRASDLKAQILQEFERVSSLS